MGMFKNLFKNLPRGRISFSQEGEDLVLARIFDNMGVKKGFYVDVGAHHPFRFSNTYYFYLRGWTGINIDALPGTKKIFKYFRSKDITIECGVGLKEGTFTYYAFNEPALNTFSMQQAINQECHKYKIINKIDIPVLTLKNILDNNLPFHRKIDFMSIDVEGLDYEVICSNDWEKYRPAVIAIELLNTSIQHLDAHPTVTILVKNGYKILAKTHNTFIFSLNNN